MGTEVKKIIHQMKKFLLVLGLLGTLVSSCSNNNDVLRSKDLDDHQLKGNVESVKVATYEAINSFGNIVKGKIKSRLYRSVEVTEFNDSGFITSTSSYTKNGELDGKRIYSYKNNQIDNIISYDSDGDLVLKTIYEWDNDLLLSTITYDNKGREGSKIIYEYDGNKSKSTSVYINKILRFKNVVLKYDGELPSESVSYDGEGKETNRTTLEYKNGKLAFHSTYKGTYAVNKDGLTTKSVDCYNVLSDYSEDVKGIFFYEYEFDKNDNWIKCTIYRGEIKQPCQIVERVITYR